jgi:hypothetical protein
MRVALQVIAFNVDPWINAMLRNAAPHVDKIFLAYPPRPWGYSSTARASIQNPTKLESIDRHDLACEIEVVHGDWLYDEDTRNCLLDQARNEGFDWMVIQDADEFYTEASWKRLLAAMERANNYDLLITPWFNFWKSPEYVIDNRGSGIKCLNEGFAVRAKNSHARFMFSRTTDAKHRLIVDEPCYHYGYVMSDESMRKKIQTWAHTKEISSMRLWYELKWQRWEENTLFLHPGSPAYWLKAVRFPLQQPEFADALFGLASKDGSTKGLYWGMVDWLWNSKALLAWRIIQIKRVLRNSLNNYRAQKHQPASDC